MAKIECSITLILNEDEVKALSKLIGNMSRADMEEQKLSKDECDLVFDFWKALPFKSED